MKGLSLIGLLLISTVLQVSAQKFIPYPVKVPDVKRDIIMIPVEGGTFYMGSPENEVGRNEDEGPQHEVSVSSFWMGETEITWDQYEAFVYKFKQNFAGQEKLEELGIDGVTGATTPYVNMSFGMGKGDHPAINMTQYAALMYCKWLSAMTGEFYRLPTEAEWEYACKAGMDRVYSFGKDVTVLREYAIFGVDNYEEVGSKKAPSTGLFDMNGNVAEWTMDQYDADFYSKSPKDDPWLKPDKLYPRTLRGGSWKEGPEKARCTSRMASNPRWKRRDPQLPKSRWWHTNAPYVGFRIVRPKVQPPKNEIERFWLEAMEDYGN